MSAGGQGHGSRHRLDWVQPASFLPSTLGGREGSVTFPYPVINDSCPFILLLASCCVIALPSQASNGSCCAAA